MINLKKAIAPIHNYRCSSQLGTFGCKANGGSIDYFVVAEKILDQVNNKGKIRLLQQRQDD